MFISKKIRHQQQFVIFVPTYLIDHEVLFSTDSNYFFDGL
jgi:hypothetical protein